jgi:GTP1/Obg family GTP-binding protein
VPLSKQALSILQAIWSLSDNGDVVLPSIRSLKKSLSEGAMISALRRLGYGHNNSIAAKQYDVLEELEQIVEKIRALGGGSSRY